MKIEDILNTFSDINHMYNNSTAYDTLEHMLHQLVEDVSFASSHREGAETNPCFDCGFWDSEREGCTCYPTDLWYACPIESRKPENQKDLRMIANEHIEEYFMGKANPLPPEDMPEDIIAVTRWGGGNYYLEDRELGKTIRITPDVFWAILEKVHEAMKVAQLNGVEV